MYQPDPAVMDDEHAVAALDVHFSMTLGCTVADLRRPGWTIVSTRDDGDPMALLFGQRTLLSLLAPAPRTSDETDISEEPAVLGQAEKPGKTPRAGVALIAPELRAPVTALLRTMPPETLFTADGLSMLHQLLDDLALEPALVGDEAHMRVCYVARAGYTPYQGQWQEWIEPLDESSELEPLALGLLARYSGGVYVVRNAGTIATYAGIRTHSPYVAEINVQTAAEELRGHALGRAVVSRATKAIFAGGRVPLYRYHASNTGAAHIAAALGYRFYADAVTYITPL